MVVAVLLLERDLVWIGDTGEEEEKEDLRTFRPLLS